jgi:peptidoglycan/LPS O-acetylase OafA/YrhL
MLNHGGSFNGPSWSITAEIVAYAIFFFLAFAKLIRGWRVSLLISLSGFLIWQIDNHLGRSVTGFFAGGCAYRLLQSILRHSNRLRVSSLVFTVTILGWMSVFMVTYGDILPRWGIDIRDPLTRMTLLISLRYVLFPLTVLSAAILEQLYENDYTFLAGLGRISYSSYLIHFPLQICFAIAIVGGLFSQDFGRSVAALIGFMVALIALSTLSFHLIEGPAQALIRNAFDKSWSRMQRKALKPD